ncbi:MAG: thioesterase [Clostridiales bacterium]|nr:MAG: thioesterase [Clostridiales bacterium]
MDFNLKIGMKAKMEIVVKESETAASYGSGGVRVYATPAMIGLIENTSLNAVDPFLPEGYATVGTHLDVKHLAATPVGMKVTATAELIEIDRKKLVFKVEAFDEKDKIGEGTHSRFIIEKEKFLKMTEEKAASK